MGKPINEIYDDFEEKPLASASLAQVHKAKLKETGETVAVKVQHRWIKERVPGDLLIIESGIAIATYLFPEFSYSWLAKEF